MNHFFYIFVQIFIFSLLFPIMVNAQGEQLGIRIENRGNASLNQPSPALGEDTQVSLWSANINASIKKKIDKQKLGLTTLILGAEYRFTGLNYDQLTAPTNNEFAENLHMLRLQIDYTKIIKQKKILSVFFRPGIFTDFENLDWSHARIEGLVLLDYIKSKETIIGFGVGRSAGFGRVLVLPVFHYLYRSPKFIADILLPSRVDIGWIKNKWYMGFNASVTGNQFQLGNLQNGFAGSDRIGVSDLTLGPVLRYNTGKKAYFLLEGGMTGLRRWEFRNDDLDKDERFIQEFDPKVTWFLRTGFVIRH